MFLFLSEHLLHPWQVWNGTTAVWTLSALAAGSVIGAAFSLPFWFAGEPRPAACRNHYTCLQAQRHLASASLPAAETADVACIRLHCAQAAPVGPFMRGMALSSTVAAGYQVAKDALGGVLSSEHLTLGKRKWKLRRGKEIDEGAYLLTPSLGQLLCSQGKVLGWANLLLAVTASSGVQ